LPRSKKQHIFVLVSCIDTAVSDTFALLHFSLVEDPGEAASASTLDFGVLLVASLDGRGNSMGILVNASAVMTGNAANFTQ
jgi:hypothetical protein